MSQSARRRKSEAQLRTLEEDFTADLISALRECAAGKWGIFGQNDHLASKTPLLRSVYTEPAERLIDQGNEIMEMRRELGYTEPFTPFERYLHYRQMRSADAPGEPKLAAQFLVELGVAEL